MLESSSWAPQPQTHRHLASECPRQMNTASDSGSIPDLRVHEPDEVQVCLCVPKTKYHPASREIPSPGPRELPVQAAPLGGLLALLL